MPLWKFNYAETKKLAVCSLAWVPKYPDAIVCGYGSCKLNNLDLYLFLLIVYTL